MSVIDRIKAKLGEYPGIRYSEAPNEIEVHPTDDSGFAVGLRVSDHAYTVWFDGWHEDFASEDEALDCFVFGLSPGCRLAVVLRGDTTTKWIVESLRDGQWTQDSVTGLLLQPFWRKACLIYRQNRLIAAG